VNPAALWKVQMRFLELGGNAVPVNSSEVLFQHVQTGLYLSSQNGCADLTSDLHSPSCMWTFSPMRTGTSEDQPFVSHGKLVRAPPLHSPTLCFSSIVSLHGLECYRVSAWLGVLSCLCMAWSAYFFTMTSCICKSLVLLLFAASSQMSQMSWSGLVEIQQQ
jgi:hypothetical protein